MINVRSLLEVVVEEIPAYNTAGDKMSCQSEGMWQCEGGGSRKKSHSGGNTTADEGEEVHLVTRQRHRTAGYAVVQSTLATSHPAKASHVRPSEDGRVPVGTDTPLIVDHMHTRRYL